jgi:hypothetical protein
MRSAFSIGQYKMILMASETPRKVAVQLVAAAGARVPCTIPCELCRTPAWSSGSMILLNALLLAIGDLHHRPLVAHFTSSHNTTTEATPS